MDTTQVQAQPTQRPVHVSMVAALLKLLQQPTRKPLFDNGKHARAGITKNKMQPRNKSRVRMAKQSRARNRGR